MLGNQRNYIDLSLHGHKLSRYIQSGTCLLVWLI